MNTNKLPNLLLVAAIILSLFASCNSGNKVVSSFGKRKYTKGFYLNLPSRTNTVAVKQRESKQNEIAKKPVVENTIQVIAPQLSDKASEALPITIYKPTINLQAAGNDFPDTFKVKNGTPSHVHVFVNSDDKQRSDELDADADAKYGFLWGVVGILTVILGVGVVFGIIGLIMSTKGLKSKEYQGKAIAGVILSILTCVTFVVLVVLAIAALAAM